MSCFFEIKKGITIGKVFQKTLDEPGRKPNKIWVDKGSAFYNKSMKLWKHDNNIEIYSGKPAVTEVSFRTLQTHTHTDIYIYIYYIYYI